MAHNAILSLGYMDIFELSVSRHVGFRADAMSVVSGIYLQLFYIIYNEA